MRSMNVNNGATIPLAESVLHTNLHAIGMVGRNMHSQPPASPIPMVAYPTPHGGVVWVPKPQPRTIHFFWNPPNMLNPYKTPCWIHY